MIEIRDAVRELLDMQLDNADNSYDSDIADYRARLNEKYDACYRSCNVPACISFLAVQYQIL